MPGKTQNIRESSRGKEIKEETKPQKVKRSVLPIDESDSSSDDDDQKVEEEIELYSDEEEGEKIVKMKVKTYYFQ